MSEFTEAVKCFIRVNYYERPMADNVGVMGNLRSLFKRTIALFFRQKRDDPPNKLEARFQERRELLAKYRKSILELDGLIEEQKRWIEHISGHIEDEEDIWENISNVKDQLVKICIHFHRIELETASKCLEGDDLYVLSCLQIFELIDKYQSEIYERGGTMKKIVHKPAIRHLFVDWRAQYFCTVTTHIQSFVNRLIHGLSEDMKDLEKANAETQLISVKNQISAAVYFKRKRKNWTQERLSKCSGIGRSMIAKVEQSQQATSIEAAVRLLTPLDMTLAVVPYEASSVALTVV